MALGFLNQRGVWKSKRSKIDKPLAFCWSRLDAVIRGHFHCGFNGSIPFMVKPPTVFEPNIVRPYGKACDNGGNQTACESQGRISVTLFGRSRQGNYVKVESPTPFQHLPGL